MSQSPLIQKYKILSPLAKGGIGETFLAADLFQEERLVVLKKVPKTSVSKNIESHRKEFATLSRLAHPNIARVFEFGEDAEGYFFVEECVEGTDIFEATHQANYNQVLSALAQLLRALNYLHQQGLIHGDLKAENILVVKNASLFQEDAVKLIDFGLAKTICEIRSTERPSGTLHFMAPEVLKGLAYDHRADLYALGVTLYRMLTGRFPFEGEIEENRLDKLIQAQIERMPVAPERFRSDLSKGLSKLTMKLLQKSPFDRFQSAAEVLRALNESEGERFPLWTEAEFQISLHQGSFVGRERELKFLWDHFRKGERQFVFVGESGIGKTRLLKEFQNQLQLAGDKEGVEIEEYDYLGNTPQSTEIQRVVLNPWTRSETEFFVKDRLRIKFIPEEWRAVIEPLTNGNPQKTIALLEHWLSEGILVIEKNQARFVGPPPKASLDFEKILSERLKTLEKNKRQILELCAFARTPLSKDLLQRITGLSSKLLDTLVESLEKDHWLQRILYNGTYHYVVESQKGIGLLGPSRKASSIEALLNLTQETYRAGNHLLAKRYLEDLLSKFHSPGEMGQNILNRLYTIASLVFLETGDLPRAREFCESFLRLPDLKPLDQGKILNRLGWIEYREGHYSKALEIFDQAVSYWDLTDEKIGKASVANFLGMCHQALGERGKARASYKKALSHLPPDHPWQAMIGMNLATAAQAAEDYSEAIAQYELASQASHSGNDRNLEVRVLNNWANLFLYLGRLDRAGATAHESLRLAIENGLGNMEAHNYLLLSIIADKEGRLEEFRDLIQKAILLFEKEGSTSEKANARLHEAYYFFTSGDEKKADELLNLIRTTYPTETAILTQCDLLEGKIAARKDPPDLSRGEAPLQRALEFYEVTGDEANLWEIVHTLGQLYRQKNPEKAKQFYQRTLSVVEKLARKIPEEFRSSFFRDRKRERIMAELSSLSPTSAPKEKGEAKSYGLIEVARINRLIASEQNLNYLLETILEESLELLQAERGFILLPNKEGFRIHVSRNIDRKILEGAEELYSATIAKRAAAKGQTILVVDAQADDRFKTAESVIDLELRAVLAVPMKIGAEVLGVIYVDNRFRRGVFDEEHQKWLEAFADQAALALRNARQNEEIRQRQKELEDSKKKIEELNELLKERLDKTEQDYAEVREKYRLQQEELQQRYSYEQIIGKSEKLKDVFKILDRVTDSDVTVLITGETGTGKELIARALHYNSARKDHPFVTENCAAFSETLLESELFGHVKGSFTGATEDHEGIFEAAEGGSVFLDEIGDMPLGMQAKLLRVLQERQIRPIGGKEYQKVNIRIIAATNKDLARLVKEGKFREDLYYRINVVRVGLPALRDRKGDIPMLVNHFLRESIEEGGKEIRFHPKAMEWMVRYEWPGNIRELANEVQKCLSMGSEVVIPEMLSPKILEESIPLKRVIPLDQQIKHTEKNLILEALKKFRFSRNKTAQALGFSRITLYKKMKSYGIRIANSK